LTGRSARLTRHSSWRIRRFATAIASSLLVALAWCSPGLTTLAFSRDARSQVQRQSPHHRTEKTKIVVGVSQIYKALAWVDDDGQPEGLAAEVFRAAASAVGLEVEFRVVKFSDQKEALNSGAVDALVCLPVTNEWIAGAAYAQPILISDGVVYSRRNSPTLNSAAALIGQRVGVSLYGPEHFWLTQQGASATTMAQTVSELMVELIEGRIDYLPTARFRGRLALSTLPNASAIVETEIEGGGFRSSYAAVVRQGDTALLGDLNDGLLIIRDRGDFDRIYQSRIGNLQPRPAPPGTVSRRVVEWSAIGVLGVLVWVGLWQWMLRSQLAKRTRELRTSESKYRGFFENCQDAVMIVDPETSVILDANRAAETIYGYADQELREMLISRVTTDLDGARRAMTQVMESDGLMAIRCRHVRKNGDRFPVEINVTTVESDGRRLVVSFVRDISERVRAEMAMFVDQENYRNIFNGAGSGILVVSDETGKVLDANSAACRMYGLAHRELVGSGLAALVGTALIEVGSGALDWEALTGRHRHTRLGSTSFEAEVRVSSVEFMNRRARLLLVQDITARLRAEDERRELEAQLLQAQKLEGLGLLAGGIAHDFNNLLVGIMGNADMAASQAAPGSEVRDRLVEIVSATRYASDLTHQLLAYAGRVQFSPGAVDLRSLCRDSVRLLGARLGANVRIEFDFPERMSLVNADPTLLRQVVTNLLVNASDALGEMSGVVTVSVKIKQVGLVERDARPVEHALSPGQYACIEVSDTGCGIEASRLGTIFDPFVSSKAAGGAGRGGVGIGGGRGLGLAVAMSVVKRHRGSIEVRSQPGEGSTFRVLIPVVGAMVSVVAGADATRGPVNERPASGGAVGGAVGRVLLADDEPRVLDVTRRLLESKGWSVRAVPDGRALLDVIVGGVVEGAVGGVAGGRADGEVFDVIVIDAIMPGIPGSEVIRRVRAIRPDAAIVTVSGYSPDHLGGHGSMMGADAFVQKPFTIDELLEGIGRARSQQRPRPIEPRPIDVHTPL